MPDRLLTGVPVAPGIGVPPDATVLASFLGAWDVRRIIVDHLSGAVHRFAGTATIGASSFAETGEVTHGAVSLKANRGYGLQWRADVVDISFPDGRAFVCLDGRALQIVRHLCGDDNYRGRFVFDTDTWLEAWRVSGPRKRYASLARYRRQGV